LVTNSGTLITGRRKEKKMVERGEEEDENSVCTSECPY